MSMKVQVPVSALADPEVAASLARLVEALGAAGVRAPMAAPARVVRPSAPVRSEDPTERWSQFIEALPERSRQFLELVQSRDIVTIDEAMEALEVTVGKAMGGITGSIARWAPEYGVSVPFEAVKGPQGKRAWRWIGLDRPPAPPVPVRRRRRRAEAPSQEKRPVIAAPRSPPPPTPPTKGPDREERIATLYATLPLASRRLVDLVRERGQVSQSEILGHFGLARAAGLPPILRPVLEAAALAGLNDLLVTAVSNTGERSWIWTPAEEPALMEPQAPGQGEAGRPGVRVRKRP